MKRLCLASTLLLTVFATIGLLAQEASPGVKEVEAEDSKELFWKLVNFAILAGALGYFIYKKSGGYFLSRSESIRRDLSEADRLRREADERAAEIEARLRNLDAEIAALRAHAREEMAAENERLRQETAEGLRKIRAQTEQEIQSAAKAARQEVRSYAAQLAVGLAAEKIRARLDPRIDERLLLTFLNDLEAARGGKSATELN